MAGPDNYNDELGFEPADYELFEGMNLMIALRQIIASSSSTSAAFPRSAAFDPNTMSSFASTGPILGFTGSTYAGPTSKAALDPLMISLDLRVSRHPT